MLILRNSVEQSPSWEAGSRSASQDPKIHYRVHNSPPLDANLNRLRIKWKECNGSDVATSPASASGDAASFAYYKTAVLFTDYRCCRI